MRCGSEVKQSAPLSWPCKGILDCSLKTSCLQRFYLTSMLKRRTQQLPRAPMGSERSEPTGSFYPT